MSIKITVKGRQSTMDFLRRSVKKDIERKEYVKKLQLVEKLKEVTPVDTGKARDGWHATRNGIENNVEYIDKLNEGTSQQAPSYFVESTLLSNRDVNPNGIIVRHK